jgi:K+ transporter
MKKTLKGCLIFFSIIIIIVAILIGWVYYSTTTSKEREREDIIECKSSKFITEKPSLSLEKKSESEISEISVYLERNKKIIKDTILKNSIGNKKKYFTFSIPFEKFLKTDIIIVEVKNAKYEISGFNHNLESRWVMFGYNGGECLLDYNEVRVNNKKYNGAELEEEEYENNKIILPKK